MFFSKKTTAAFFVFAIVILLYHLSLLGTADALVRAILNPLQSSAVLLAQSANTELSLALSSKRALLLRVRELEEEVRTLTAEVLALQKTRRENEELRGLLRFETETDFTLVPARVIYITHREGERIVLLNKGTREGIQKGDAVVIGNGTMIGKVMHASANTARVRLTIDNKSAVLASAGGEDDVIAGVARGNQNATIRLELIPKNIPLVVGSAVYTNGLEERIPPSLFIGSIAVLEESDNEIFNAAAIIPPYSMENLTIAAVVTRP